MPVSYRIQADVVDIRRDAPRPDDVFLVDSNIWYWTTYIRTSQADTPPRHYQVLDYPGYLNRVLSARAQLCRCELSLAELAHLIEKTELEIFSRTTGFDKSKRKEFRHNCPHERLAVVSEIESAWEQVKTIAKPVAANIDESAAASALRRCYTQFLDGYDLFLVEALTRAGIFKVITDDGDFATVPGIVVFTSNRNVIHSAMSQGKMITR